MSEKLFRLKSPLISNGLISALRNPDSVSVEEVDCTVDPTNLSTLIDQLILEKVIGANLDARLVECCLLYTSPSPRDISGSRMPSSA